MFARAVLPLRLRPFSRAFLALAFLAGAAAFAAPPTPRLTARPGEPAEPAEAGLHDLGLGRKRDGFVYVSSHYDPATPAPLLVLLHGAGGAAKRAWSGFAKLAEPRGLIVVAIDSRSHRTWDIMLGYWGPDVRFIDTALAHVFARYRIDPTHIALGGFSDGASYALSLGAANGDLFTHLVALAPGSIRPVHPHGRPRIFVSHGTRDSILPVQISRRGIVPKLHAAGYDVVYRETGLDHELDWDTSVAMLDWFLTE